MRFAKHAYTFKDMTIPFLRPIFIPFITKPMAVSSPHFLCSVVMHHFLSNIDPKSVYVCVLECRMLPFAFWCVSVFTLCGMVFAEECILKLCHKEIRLFSYSSQKQLCYLYILVIFYSPFWLTTAHFSYIYVCITCMA